MYLQGITVCYHYSDFLAYTLPFNKSIFNYYVVVTSPDDKKTLDLCEFYNINCVVTTQLQNFNKGKAINNGLAFLKNKGWVLHLDADIILPPLTRKILEDLSLEKNCLYGVDRLMCPSHKDWIHFFEKPINMFTNFETYITTTPWNIGTRFSKKYIGNKYLKEKTGYIPLGFFQLWHTNNNKTYPENFNSMADSDVHFALQWERKYRQLIPELLVIHLESDEKVNNKMGANWKKRQTRTFSIKEKYYFTPNLDIKYE